MHRFSPLLFALWLGSSCAPPAGTGICPPPLLSPEAPAARLASIVRLTRAPTLDGDSGALLIRGAVVWTATGTPPKPADVLVRQGRIVAVGTGLAAPVGARVVDGAGRHLTPGLIDPHSHLGVYPAPSLEGHADGNEVVKPIDPALRALDAFWPQDPGIPRALRAGVTAVAVVPGSANLIGGEGFIIRPIPGRSASELLFDGGPRILKMACGENPKRVYGEKGGPGTRMGNVARVRTALLKARDYERSLHRYNAALRRWQVLHEQRCQKTPEGERPPDFAAQEELPPERPGRDIEAEVLLDVMAGRVQVHMHCYRADEMQLMLDLAAEFGFTIRAFHHATEAYKIREQLRASGTGAVVWVNWWGFKVEALDAIPEAAALLDAAAVPTALHSDSALVIQRLNQEAALAYYRGLELGLAPDEDRAIRLVTLGPARLLGLDHLTGSVEVGKLADLTLWDRHPLSVYARAEKVFIEGRLLFDRLAQPGVRPTDFELGLVQDPDELNPVGDSGPTPSLPTGWAVPPESPWTSQPAAQQVPPPLAIVGAQVHTLDGDAPPRETVVLVENGLVKAVGPGLAMPAGVRILDGKGLVLTPGLVASETALGLVEITMEATARDHRPEGRNLSPVRPDLRAWEALNLESMAIPVSRIEGFTTALVRPFGGLVSGQSAAFDLLGSSVSASGLRAPLGVHVNLGIEGSRAASGSRALALMRLRRLLEDARSLRNRRQAVESRRFRPLSAPIPQVEALVPVVERRIPLVVSVDRASDIEAVLRLGEEQGLRLVLSGVAEGWQVAALLARSRVPVLLPVDVNLPSTFDALNARYDNAARLHRAGVVLGFSAGGEAHNLRFLRQQAGLAVAWGLPHRAALAALTRDPAAMFGLTDRGVIRPGALANLVVWSGDPLELSTRVLHLIIHGEIVALASRQTLLRDRYRSIPPR